MSDRTEPEGVAPLSDEDSVAVKKFGEAAKAGFQVVPDILLKSQKKLGISHVEMVVLLNILMHWWTPGQNPYPRASTIAKRMKSSQRTVQRAIASLEDKVILRKVEVQGKTTFDPSPLVSKLEGLVKEDFHYQYRRDLHTGEKASNTEVDTEQC